MNVGELIAELMHFPLDAVVVVPKAGEHPYGTVRVVEHVVLGSARQQLYDPWPNFYPEPGLDKSWPAVALE